MKLATTTVSLLLSSFFLLPSSFSATSPITAPPSATINLTDPARPTLFLAGYAHLDTQYRWDYVSTIRDYLPRTFNTNLEYFAKYPHYTFNFTGAGRYKLIKDYYPEAYEKIRSAIAAGRWWPAGVSWEENDANIPSAESQIRQFLLGSEFYRKEFNTEPSNEYMLPDCFGFPASLPSILYHCGIRGFSTQKLLTWGSANGVPFNVGEWIGPDGNSVIAALNALRYGRIHDKVQSRDPDWIKRLADNGAKTGLYADFTYMGIGDRGGAPKDPSVPNMEKSLKSTKDPIRVLCPRADLFFNSITDAQLEKLPKYTGDLLLIEHSAGCLTSQSYMKHWNRANELLADAAERASVAAHLLGAPYPREKLNAAWQLVLRSQMHDTLPGTCIPKAYEYSWNDEVLCLNLFSEILTHAVATVAASLDTRPPPTASIVPLVIYNPLSIPREDIVEATIPLPNAAPVGASLATPSLQVLDPTGAPVPTQLLSHDPVANTARIAFLAKAPPIGFAVYQVASVPYVPSVPSVLSVTTTTLENPRYRITLNLAGDISSIYDKQSSRELLSAPARLEFQTESPAKTPAWDMDWTDRKNPPRAYVDGKPTIEILERGPARVALRITRAAEGSTITQTIRLTVGSLGGTTSVSSSSSSADRIEIATTIDWLTKSASLKAAFPLTISNPLATYNNDLGKIQRSTNDPKKYEVPTHQWFDLTAPDDSYGVTILTAAKYGTDKPTDNTLRLTLLYTPDVSKSKKYKEQRTQDWGRHDFTYGIYAHPGAWSSAGSDWQALRMEQPLLAFTTTSHPGPLGRTHTLLSLDTDAIAVRAVKLAETTDQIIIRLQELTGTPQTAHLTTAPPLAALTELNGVEKTLGPATPALTFQKYQLRTLALTPVGASLATPSVPPLITTPLALPHNINAISHRGEPHATGFDNTGATLPAEMLPAIITAEGIAFKLAPAVTLAQSKIENPKSKISNALRCEAQTLPLPAGNHNRLYLLAASATDADTPATFLIDTTPTTLLIQSWLGYIGQWDNRVFEGTVPETAESIPNPLARIDAGYIKRAPVAWYCDHHYLPNGKTAIYQYCYLFKYALDLPPGAKTLTLPNNPNIRILAMTAAADPASATRPAQPLYDDFTNRHPITIPKGWANFE